jgi:hypothetical protein
MHLPLHDDSFRCNPMQIFDVRKSNTIAKGYDRSIASKTFRCISMQAKKCTGAENMHQVAFDAKNEVRI